MRITVNGEPRDVLAATLAALLDELGYAGARLATAFDGDFVPTGGRRACALREGCAIEILAPRQGG